MSVQIPALNQRPANVPAGTPTYADIMAASLGDTHTAIHEYNALRQSADWHKLDVAAQQRCEIARQQITTWSEQAAAVLDAAFALWSEYSPYDLVFFAHCEQFFNRFRYIKENRERALEELSRATNHALASV